MSNLTKPQARAIHALLVTLAPDARADIVIEFNDITVSTTASNLVLVQDDDGSVWHHSIENFALSYGLDDPSLT